MLSRSSGERLAVSLRPRIREQVGEVGLGRTNGQLGQDVRQVRPRVETVLPGTGTDAEQDGGGLQPAIAADVQPVLKRPITV